MNTSFNPDDHPRSQDGKFSEKSVDEANGGLDALNAIELDTPDEQTGQAGLFARLISMGPPDEQQLAQNQTEADEVVTQRETESSNAPKIVKTDPSRFEVEAMLAAGVSKDLRVWETCDKCQGTGSVSWGIDVDAVVGGRTVSRVCFDCNGPGGKASTLGAINRRWKDRDRREVKRAAEAEKKVAEHLAKQAAETAERDAKRAEFERAHADVVAALPTMPGEFGASLREQLDERGELSVNQCRAVLRIAAENAARPTAVPVVEGRGEVSGTVISTKWVDDFRGNSVMKMVVLDDRGFKVYGTVPDSLKSSNYYDETGTYQHQRGIEKGDRVTFTATNEQSKDDETFGFFKRPTKATFEPAAEPGPDLDRGRELATLAGATTGTSDDRLRAVLAAHAAGKIAQEDLVAVDAWIKHDTAPKNFSTDRLIEHYGLTSWGDEARRILTDAKTADELTDAQLLAVAKRMRGEA